LAVQRAALKRTMTERALPDILALVNQLGPALEQRARTRVNDIISQLIALKAPMGEQWQQLAYIAFSHGEIRLARQAMDQLVAAQGGGHVAQYQKAGFLSLLGAWGDADALLRTLPETVPDPVNNMFSRGTAALHLGRIAEAQDYLERVTRMRPQAGLAWYSLAMSADLAQETDLAERLIAAGRVMDRGMPAERVAYQYALGKAHAERGDHAAAFAAFTHGAALLKPSLSYNRAADAADAARAIEGYDAERIAALAGAQREPTGRTIFVTGLPRSGTTLVEHILTSHSAVSDGGEVARLFMLAGEAGGGSPSALAQHVEAHGAASIARLWHHWLDEQFPGSRRVVDKTVDASRFLGLAAALLPEAPLIWVTRDPLDRAWSCFRTNFSGSAVPWSYDLEDIAAHFRLEDRLLAQWQAILGDRLLVLSYEALVSDPMTWIRRILTHCGLAEEPQVFAPHENKRTVVTASMVQVRRPINRDGIGTAEPYRAFLKPFIDAYYG
jgi:hypothetical protein